MDLNRGYPRKKLSLKRNKCSQENAPPKTVDCSIEDERQFKITRFVKDVNNYLEEKENTQSRAPKHGRLLNILQSKGSTRGDLGKEMKSKLDQNLRQIIGLEDKKDCHCNCKRHCKNPIAKSINKPVVNTSQAQSTTRNYTYQPLIHTIQEQQEHLYHQPHRISPSILSCRTPGSDCTSPRIEVPQKSATKTTLSFDDLDNKLYPEFVRIVTTRCLQFKSSQFKGNNYANLLKEKLLDIYKYKRRDCCSEECLSERPRSSVATSPISSISAVHEQIRDSDPPFTLNFVSERSKSIKQILQESIGPGSSVNESHYRDDESSTSELNHTYCPPLSQPCEQYSVMSRRELPRYEPLMRVTPSPVYNYPQMTVDGGGDRIILLNENNSFLPPCDEESPEFKYYPRRIY